MIGIRISMRMNALTTFYEFFLRSHQAFLFPPFLGATVLCDPAAPFLWLQPTAGMRAPQETQNNIYPNTVKNQSHKNILMIFYNLSSSSSFLFYNQLSPSRALQAKKNIRWMFFFSYPFSFPKTDMRHFLP